MDGGKVTEEEWTIRGMRLVKESRRKGQTKIQAGHT